MGQHNKIISFIVAISLIIGCIPSFGQDITSSKDNVHIGTVCFKDKSSKLTKEAKATLDTLIKQIQGKPAMQVKAVSSNKDFCDKCSSRSWKRVTAIMKYFTKHGVPKDRLVFTNLLEGESNKVEIFLAASVRDSPHPNIKKEDR